MFPLRFGCSMVAKFIANENSVWHILIQHRALGICDKSQLLTIMLCFCFTCNKHIMWFTRNGWPLQAKTHTERGRTRDRRHCQIEPSPSLNSVDASMEIIDIEIGVVSNERQTTKPNDSTKESSGLKFVWDRTLFFFAMTLSVVSVETFYAFHNSIPTKALPELNRMLFERDVGAELRAVNFILFFLRLFKTSIKRNMFCSCSSIFRTCNRKQIESGLIEEWKRKIWEENHDSFEMFLFVAFNWSSCRSKT